MLEFVNGVDPDLRRFLYPDIAAIGIAWRPLFRGEPVAIAAAAADDRCNLKPFVRIA